MKPKPLDEAIPAYIEYLEAMEREPAYRKHVAAHLRDFSGTTEKNDMEIILAASASGRKVRRVVTHKD